MSDAVNAKSAFAISRYSGFMKRKLSASAVLIVAVAAFAIVQPNSSVSANTVGVFVSNTTLSSNIGLGFCTPDTTKGCIESVTVDGVALTPVQSPSAASFFIGGGLYSGPCRFVDTFINQCEYPYLVLSPTRPRASAFLDDVVIGFRRQLGDHPTSAINAVIVNGSLQSFSPAAPGVRDVATIRAKSAETHHASSGFCVGWGVKIEQCVIGDVGTQKVTNRLSMLLLPAMRSSVVPPDAADETCKQRDPTNECLINIFDESSRGGWVDTDASVFGLTSMDRYTGAAQLKIAGPHYKTPVNGSNELNLAYFRMFLPSAYLNNSFGLRPDQANASTLPVRRTVSNGSTTPFTEYLPQSDGLLVSSSGIGFSIPTMTVQRVLRVKRNSKVTATTLLKAAGIHQTLKFGAPKISINKKHGMTFSSRRYRFTKARTAVVTITYKSTPSTKSVRRLTVQVVK